MFFFIKRWCCKFAHMKKALIFIGLLLIVCASLAQTVNIRGSKMILQYGANNYSVELKGDSVLIDASDFIWFADKIGSDTLLFGDGTYMTTAFVSGVNDTGYVKTTGDTLWGTFNFEGSNSYFKKNALYFDDGAGNYIEIKNTGIKINTVSELIYINNNGLYLSGDNCILSINELSTEHYANTTFIDDDYIDLPSGRNGWGEVYLSDLSATVVEWAEFIYLSDGTVYLKSNSANVVTTDTDGNLCIFDNGTNVRIRNRLGSTQIIKYIIHY